MLKSYEELVKVDVTPYCSDRDGFKYLNWARCVDLLRKNGAEKVYFELCQNEKTGNSLFCSEQVFTDKNGNVNQCYETRIKVCIDDQVYYMQSPVMNGKNPVKANSMTQARVWTSACRSFVKCVAINTGLGFDLWVREENMDYIPVEDTLATEQQKATLIELCSMHKIDIDRWCSSNGKTFDTITGNDAGLMLKAIKVKYGDD